MTACSAPAQPMPAGPRHAVPRAGWRWWLLAGCAATDKDPTANWTAEQLYADAKADLDAGNWTSAIKGMERLESRYPFGSYAQQAQLDIAWAHYKEGDRAEALSAIDRFIRLTTEGPVKP